ncbi:unnamed protein product [Toxocara canis]|uniref:DDE_Tnp_1_7 domain-containing protein n=1 Tax=Toxocara canis TaxID=6265 RepID=A0A183UKM6_TOXCA|nr:unnamed protein product [Toxocara canis]
MPLLNSYDGVCYGNDFSERSEVSREQNSGYVKFIWIVTCNLLEEQASSYSAGFMKKNVFFPKSQPSTETVIMDDSDFTTAPKL